MFMSFVLNSRWLEYRSLEHQKIEIGFPVLMNEEQISLQLRGFSEKAAAGLENAVFSRHRPPPPRLCLSLGNDTILGTKRITVQASS